MTREYNKLSRVDRARIRLILDLFSSGGVTANKIAKLMPHLKAPAIHAFMVRDRTNVLQPQRRAFTAAEDRRLLELYSEMGDKYASISRMVSKEGIHRSASTVFGRLQKLLHKNGDGTGELGFPPSPVSKPGEAGGSYPVRPPRLSPERRL
jgi:hypothetical protein